MARPQSPEATSIRALLASAPADRGLNARTIARELSIGYGRTQEVIDRLARAGAIAPVRTERLPGVKKPVACYAAAERVRGEWGGATSGAGEAPEMGIVRL